jgi:vacuolar-type H+-ATPase subunit H
MTEQPKTPPAGNPSPLAQSAAERLAVIIDAVERSAAGVIDDAEAQARKHLEQARERADRIAAERIDAITELTDDLIEQAEALKRQADGLIAAFAEANTEVALVGGDDPEQSPAATSTPEEPEPEPEESPAPQQETTGSRPQLSHLKPVGAPKAGSSRQPPRSVGTRLLVTQMAISGSSRREIEARLRNELGVQDTSQVVDAILGPEE